MRTKITAGQTSDYLGFDLVIADNLPEPIVLIADRAYDSDHIRKTMEVRDVQQGILVRKTRKLPVAVDARRAVLQQAEKRRIARPYDKNAESSLGFIDITNRF